MPDLILSLTPEPATERTTHTLDETQVWRQVGWIGQTGRVYGLDDEAGVRSEPGSFMPLWILAHADTPVPPDHGDNDA